MTVAAKTPKTGANTQNRMEQGGDVWVIGAKGQLLFENGGVIVLPTADPVVSGAIWNNAGTLTISAG